MLKIIAGKFKGQLLKTSKSKSTRPTQGMLREAVFNICQNQVENARFLDLFAGSGAMGFEALSRGASQATFIESDRQAISCLKENISRLHLESQTNLISFPVEKALSFLVKQNAQFDIVYIDPPYHLPANDSLIALIAKHLLASGALLFTEEKYSSKIPSKPFDFPLLSHKNSRRFGIALLHQYQFSGT